ncbi:hypothetical protein BB561_005845 [Smittium simulii]|uniref:Uncharacterized protein n=1 Tax=Smittium simulii TaxID=133385 RepID=A0A2T9Y7Y8_9FUNG|nr:hypothetical protein BB561_005845 [Smittium simulii]
MGKNTIRMIQDLKNKVSELYMDRSNLNQKVDTILYNKNIHVVQEEKQKPAIMGPHISTNTPVTYLMVYSKLEKAFPAIENIFFCSPLTDKEIKEAIFSCSKSSTIKYLLPSANEIASTTAKKADSNGTVHSEINLAKKPLQISEPETNPLFEPEAFNALDTAKNATRRASLRRLFQKPQQSTHESYSDSGFAQTQQTQATAPTAPTNNPAPNNQQSFCGRGSGKAKGNHYISALAPP